MAEKEKIIVTESVRVRIMELAPGEATTFHHHSEVVDTMFCLTGKICVEMKGQDETFNLEPGQHCRVPVGRVHAVKNVLKGNASSYLLVQGVGKYDYMESNIK